MKHGFKPFIVVIFLFCCASAAVWGRTREDKYMRAEQFSTGKIQKLMFKTGIKPNWVGRSDRFLHINKTRKGKEFNFTGPQKKSRR